MSIRLKSGQSTALHNVCIDQTTLTIKVIRADKLHSNLNKSLTFTVFSGSLLLLNTMRSGVRRSRNVGGRVDRPVHCRRAVCNRNEGDRHGQLHYERAGTALR